MAKDYFLGSDNDFYHAGGGMELSPSVFFLECRLRALQRSPSSVAVSLHLLQRFPINTPWKDSPIFWELDAAKESRSFWLETTDVVWIQWNRLQVRRELLRADPASCTYKCCSQFVGPLDHSRENSLSLVI